MVISSVYFFLIIDDSCLDNYFPARPEVEAFLKELAEDEGAYRSRTMSWFEHSPLKELLSLAAEEGMDVPAANCVIRLVGVENYQGIFF